MAAIGEGFSPSGCGAVWRQRIGRDPMAAAARCRPARTLEDATIVARFRIYEIATPAVLDGPINRNAFDIYVAKVLVPKLKPGNIVVMDNLSSHKGARRKPGLSAALQPGLQPIEKAFSKLKAHLRKADERSITGLWDVLGRLIDLLTPQVYADF